ncbi:MAG: hypothetical protein RI960_551, partial [Pseudomonadota bacterium]
MASKNPSLLTAMDMSTPDHLVRHNDTDEQETAEWIAALESVLA